MASQLIKIEINPENYKILIVDDVLSNILLLRVLLKSEKYQVITASDGYQAIEMVNSESPDLILLDVMMPGMSGFDVAQELKSKPTTSHIPIIFLTALNSHDDIVKGFKFGANDFIVKPFNKSEMLIRISHQISLLAAKRIIVKQTEELKSIIVGRDKLYSVIAHDLRAPLGSIKMVLNMLLNNIDSKTIGQNMYDMLSMANHTTEDVFTLLDNLLKWTKSQLGRQSVVQQTICLNDLIKDGIEVFRTMAELKGVAFEFHDDSNCSVYADSDMMKTVIRNLLSNAIKFSHNNGVISVTFDAKSDPEFVITHIQDRGCGIKECDKHKLLHAETHFSTFGTNNEEGSGLGLLLCEDFVRSNGGRLWFESQEGKGSTFSFSIPRCRV